MSNCPRKRSGRNEDEEDLMKETLRKTQVRDCVIIETGVMSGGFT